MSRRTVIVTPSDRYNYLTVIKEVEHVKSGVNKVRMVECVCNCGEIGFYRLPDLRRNHTKSCGCLGKIKTHGLANHRLYNVWRGILKRCFNKKNIAYKNYGGRGISIYPEWKSDFKLFYDYVTALEDYSKSGYTLDRKDNDLGYYPGNLRWANKKTQANNRRMQSNSVFLLIEGVSLTASQASKKYGINRNTIKARYYKGLTGYDLVKPVDKIMSNKSKSKKQ